MLKMVMNIKVDLSTRKAMGRKAACMAVVMKMGKKVVVITSTTVACMATVMDMGATGMAVVTVTRVACMAVAMAMGTVITDSKVASIET